jgi:hypothetical protein
VLGLDNRWIDSPLGIGHRYDITHDPAILNCTNEGMGAVLFTAYNELLKEIVTKKMSCKTRAYDKDFGYGSIVLLLNGITPQQARSYDLEDEDPVKNAKDIVLLAKNNISPRELTLFQNLNYACGAQIDLNAIVSYKKQGIAFEEVADVARNRAIEKSVEGDSEAIINCTPENLRKIADGNYQPKQ